MIRPNPTEPYNEQELALIKERQDIVRRTVYRNIRESAPIFHIPINGPSALFHDLMIAKAAMNPKNVLYRKQWREIAWELRFPPPVFHKHYDGVTRTGFIVTEPSTTGAWSFKVSTIQDLSLAQANTLDDALEWLGHIGGDGGYPGHHDPYHTHADKSEIVGDMSLIWDRVDTTGWNTDARADAWDATSEWYPVMLGAAFWYAEESTQPRRLTVGSKILIGEDATDWIMEALNAWSSPRAFYDAVGLDVKNKMIARQLCKVNADGTIGEAASAATNGRWTIWQFTSYTAATTEGRRLT